jgi:hypothetical protein
MFIDPTMNPRPALQLSAMFPATVRASPYVSLLWSEEGGLEVAHSINITSLRDARKRLEILPEKQEIDGLLYRVSEEGLWS